MVWPSIDKLVTGANSRVTGIDEIWHAAPTKPPVLVFQVSHCGSTLLARSFACLRTCFVAGEPTCTSFLIDNYLFNRMPKDIFTRTLMGLVGHLDAAAGDRRLIIKFSSSASILAPLIMEAFPGAPAICMVRDPIEVLIGLRDKEMQAFFAPHLANLDPLIMSDMTWAGVCAAIIRRKLEGLLHVTRRGATVLNYPTGAT
jgi:hypothetical protein